MIDFNRERVRELFEKYPGLKNFITAGTISLKASRTILGINKDEMYDLYLELIQAGAVVGVGYNCFRASEDLKKFLQNT